jgi:hypothetical protein
MQVMQQDRILLEKGSRARKNNNYSTRKRRREGERLGNENRSPKKGIIEEKVEKCSPQRVEIMVRKTEKRFNTKKNGEIGEFHLFQKRSRRNKITSDARRRRGSFWTTKYDRGGKRY